MIYIEFNKVNKYSEMSDVMNVISYATTPDSCLSGLRGCRNINYQNIDDPVMLSKLFNICADNSINNFERRIFHIVVSLGKRTTEFDDICVYRIAEAITSYYKNYQSVWGVHTNTDNAHVHIVINNLPIGKNHKNLSTIIDRQKVYSIANGVYNNFYENIINSFTRGGISNGN